MQKIRTWFLGALLIAAVGCVVGEESPGGSFPQLDAVGDALRDDIARVKELGPGLEDTRRGLERLLSETEEMDRMFRDGQFQQLESTVRSFGRSSITGAGRELESAVRSLKLGIGDSLKKEKEKREKGWRERVNQLVDRAREVCLAATDAGELEALLDECSSIEADRVDASNRGSDLVGQRYSEKLAGTKSAVLSWMKHLDYREKGIGKRAIEHLNRLLSPSEYPVFSEDEVRSAIKRCENLGAEITGRMVEALSGVEGYDGLDEAIGKLEAIEADVIGQEAKLLAAVTEAAKGLRDTGRAEQAQVTRHYSWSRTGDASGWTKTISTGVGGQAVGRRLKEIETEIKLIEAEKRMPRASGFEREGEEDLIAWIHRVYREALLSKNVTLAGEVYVVAKSLPDGGGTLVNYSDLRALHAFLRAKQSEDAGDVMMALMNYRECLAVQGTSEVAPTGEAGEAIQNIIGRFPELGRDPNTELLKRIDSLQAQLNRFLEQTP